jgi:hypothetical protein
METSDLAKQIAQKLMGKQAAEKEVVEEQPSVSCGSGVCKSPFACRKAGKCLSPSKEASKIASIEKETEMFRGVMAEESGKEITNDDLFGNDGADRDNAGLPTEVSNTDKTDDVTPDLEKDLAQGKDAVSNSDKPYVESGDGPTLNK